MKLRSQNCTKKLEGYLDRKQARQGGCWVGGRMKALAIKNLGSKMDEIVEIVSNKNNSRLILDELF